MLRDFQQPTNLRWMEGMQFDKHNHNSGRKFWVFSDNYLKKRNIADKYQFASLIAK